MIISWDFVTIGCFDNIQGTSTVSKAASAQLRFIKKTSYRKCGDQRKELTFAGSACFLLVFEVQFSSLWPGRPVDLAPIFWNPPKLQQKKRTLTMYWDNTVTPFHDLTIIFRLRMNG